MHFLSFILLCLSFLNSTNIYAQNNSTQGYLICESTDLQDNRNWDWGLVQVGTYFQIEGNWIKNTNDDFVFSSDSISFEEALQICKDTLILNKKSDNKIEQILFKQSFSLVARPTPFIPCYPTHFKRNFDKAFLEKLVNSLSAELSESFIKALQLEMNLENNKQILSSGIMNYLSKNPGETSFLVSFAQAANNYKKSTEFEWQSKDDQNRVIELVQTFKHKTDQEIIFNQLEFKKGTTRGPFNSYIDLISETFSPSHKQNFPNFFDSNDKSHKKIHFISTTVNDFASIKGFLDKFASIDSSYQYEDILMAIEQYQSTVQLLIVNLEKLFPLIENPLVKKLLMQVYEQLNNTIHFQLIH